MPRPLLACSLPLIAIVLGGAALPRPLVAQEARPTLAASREDSVRALRTARGRQAAFERVRRANLPWTPSGGGGWCDERIGRFCITYSSPSDRIEWKPPPEKEAVIRARERLLAELETAARTIPGDGWVAGQRVRYLVEAGDFAAAAAVASACRGEEWWCDALRGFSAHHAGEAARAHHAFDDMLLAMPENTLREWTDLTTVLEPGTARRYRRLSGVERAEFEKRFWALATPLHGTGGNELRSEHLSRNLLATLQRRSKTTEDLPWGDDLREILLRFGTPSGWERIRNPYIMHTHEVSLVSRYPDADLDLLPPVELLADPFDPTAGEWDVEGRRARASYPLPRSGERLRWFTPFDHQIALFQDADSALLVAAYSLPVDSLAEPERVSAALTVMTSPDAPPVTAEVSAAGAEAALTLRLPHEPVLATLEALAAGERRAGRARTGVAPRPPVPGLLAASDLLLLHLEGDVPTESREEAVRLARGSTRLAPGERVGVYWEMYSPAVEWPEALEVSLRMVEANTGWLRRLAQRVGVVQEVQPIRVVWDDATRGTGAIARSISLQIPEDTRAGGYLLELTLTAPGREPIIVTRTIEVVQ